MKKRHLILLCALLTTNVYAMADSKSPCMRRMTITQDTTEVGYIDVEDRNCYYILTAVANPGYHFERWSDGAIISMHEANHMEADYTAYFVAVTPSKLSEPQTVARPQKYIQDGHLYIRVGENLFDGVGNKQKGGKL